MNEEEVADMRWVGFITAADRRGGHYRPRSSSPTAYGGFSDIWQCDALFFGDVTAVVAVKKLRAVKLPQGLDKSQTSKRLLKDNVLIDQLERPRITDFGLSKIVEEEPSLTSLRSASLQDAGNTRWIAPELLLEEGVSRSKRTDIYSFGCVVFFIFTGDVPFKGIADGHLVISRYKGASPIQDDLRYPDLDSNTTLMEIMRSCWDKNPQLRPDIGDIVSSLTNQPNADGLGPVEMPKPPSAVSAILKSAKLRSKQVLQKLWSSMQKFWGRILRSRGLKRQTVL
ncbi:hypothetical protein FRC00_007291 [Tulasnella sp. 408]|nr:hypothetical protein FRC00_007291 [Tulasnella sp. 408]